MPVSKIDCKKIGFVHWTGIVASKEIERMRSNLANGFQATAFDNLCLAKREREIERMSGGETEKERRTEGDDLIDRF